MKFAEFCSEMHAFWSSRLLDVLADDALGQSWGARVGYVPLYPTLLLCTDAGAFFIAELTGARREYCGLAVKKQRERAAENYFFPFEAADTTNASLLIEGERYSFTGLVFAGDENRTHIEERFPFLRRFGGVGFVNPLGGPPVRFAPTSNFTCFTECMMLSQLGGTPRLKWTVCATVVRADTTTERCREVMSDWVASEYGRHAGFTRRRASELGRLDTAMQLSSLFLSRAREPTLGSYLATHPDVVTRALGVKAFLSERPLMWQEGTGRAGDRTIIPDLLLEERDGSWSICDLKLALLDRQAVVKGERKRRRFIDDVAEGIGQLAHYAEYFHWEANRRWVKERYGADFSSDPRLTLVVGSSENVTPTEVAEAARAYRTVRIVDWDSFVTGYLQPTATSAA